MFFTLKNFYKIFMLLNKYFINFINLRNGTTSFLKNTSKRNN